MPVEHAIWRVGSTPARLAPSRLVSEQLLEDMIVREPAILSDSWMLIGRQEMTDHGGRIDLLAIAPDASLVLIELKRHRTPREIVAQALDYASWLTDLGADRIARIYDRFTGGRSLGEDFHRRFGTPLEEEALNQSHQIIIVAAELDASTERIVEYLNTRDIAINVLFFRIFEHGDDQLLSRVWLIDPGETQVNAATAEPVSSQGKAPWNGEFYVSYGGNPARIWEEARRYGFISAGGGAWYSQTLRLLSPGDRVWVNVPGTGYVGVGRVTEAVSGASEFTVDTSEGARSVLDVLERADVWRNVADDPEKSEYFVRVQWLDTRPLVRAFKEVGLFGSQHSVCQPRSLSWRHTVDRLKTAFPLWNA